MLNLCGVCRCATADLISLKFNDAGTKRILYKLRCFISANVSGRNYFVNLPFCQNFMMNFSQVIDYDPYLTSFICLQCWKNLEVAFKFKKACDAMNAGHQQALKPIPKPSQINGTTSHDSTENAKMWILFNAWTIAIAIASDTITFEHKVLKPSTL